MNKKLIQGAAAVVAVAGMLVTNVTFAANSTSTAAHLKAKRNTTKVVKVVRPAKKPMPLRSFSGKGKKRGVPFRTATSTPKTSTSTGTSTQR